MKAKIKIGWAMTRVSSEAQGLTQNGSLDAQDSRIQRFIESKNQYGFDQYKIVKLIREEQSAFREKNTRRPELLELMDEMRKRKINFICIESVSRLIRDTKLATEIYHLAIENGVEIWEVESGMNYTDPSNPYSFQAFGNKAISSEVESMVTSNRVATKHREAMVNFGKDPCPRPILGLDSHPNRVGMYVLNKDELLIVNEIMEAFIRFKSYSETVDFCNANKFKTKAYLTKEKIDKNGYKVPPKQIGGELFNQTSLKALLSNSKYSGKKIFKDTKNQFPRLQDADGFVIWSYSHGELIDQELLNKVKEVMVLAGFKKRPRKISTKEFSLLGGLISDKDGNFYQCHSAKKGKYSYYKNAKTKHGLSIVDFDKQFFDLLQSYTTDSSDMATVVNDYIESLKKEIDGFGDGVITISIEIANLNKQLDALTFRRRQLMADNGSEKFISSITDEIKITEAEIQSMILKKVELNTIKEAAMMSYDPSMLKANLVKLIKKIQASKGTERSLLVRSIVEKIVVDSVKEARVVFNVTNLVSPSRAKPGGNKFVGTEKWWCI